MTEDVVTKVLKKFVQEDTAATAVEYGLLIAFIAVAITATLSALGSNLVTKWIEPIVINMGGSVS
jgi:Flp pilus assembly pilin Flp